MVRTMLDLTEPIFPQSRIMTEAMKSQTVEYRTVSRRTFLAMTLACLALASTATAQNPPLTKPLRVGGTPEFQRAVSELVPMIEQMAPGIPNARWLAIRLLDGDAKVQQALVSGDLAQLVQRQSQVDVQFSKKMSVEGRQ